MVFYFRISIAYWIEIKFHNLLNNSSINTNFWGGHNLAASFFGGSFSNWPANSSCWVFDLDNFHLMITCSSLYYMDLPWLAVGVTASFSSKHVESLSFQ